MVEIFFGTDEFSKLTERSRPLVRAEIISLMWLPPLSQLTGKISGSVRKLQCPGIVWAAFRQVLLNIHPLKAFPACNQAQYALVPRLSITDAPNEPRRSLVMKIHKTLRLFLTPIRWRAEGIWPCVRVHLQILLLYGSDQFLRYHTLVFPSGNWCLNNDNTVLPQGCFILYICKHNLSD